MPKEKTETKASHIVYDLLRQHGNNPDLLESVLVQLERQFRRLMFFKRKE